MNKIFVISVNRSYNGLEYIIEQMHIQGVKFEVLKYNFDKRNKNESIIRAIKKFKIDMEILGIENIFIMGNGWEVFVIAMIASINNITIFHQGGGEGLQNGKPISQLADYHFVIDHRCLLRLSNYNIIENVYICGSPRLDNDKSKLKKLKLKKTGLVIYNPIADEVSEVIDSLRYFDMNYIILFPELSKESEIVIDEIEDFALNDNVILKKVVSCEKYHNILNSIDVLICNNDSVIESCNYNLPTVNICDDIGRDYNDNVINVKCDKHEIVKAIDYALSTDFKEICDSLSNMFGDGTASEYIVSEIKEILCL